MLTSTRPVLFTILLAIGTSLVYAQDMQDKVKQIAELPPLPKEFSWHIYQNVILPKPKNWHADETWKVSADGITSSTYLISPEKFWEGKSQSKSPETKMTIQIVSKTSADRLFDAEKIALANFIVPIVLHHKKEDFLMLDEKKQGNYKITYMRYKDILPNSKPIIVHKHIASNNAANVIYIFTFESTTASWQKNWNQYGKLMFNQQGFIGPPENK